MYTCQKCGKVLDDNVKFCPECGTEITAQTIEYGKTKNLTLTKIISVLGTAVLILSLLWTIFNNFIQKSIDETPVYNPHNNCHYVGKDREYFAGPMVDKYYSYEHPEWGYHTH